MINIVWKSYFWLLLSFSLITLGFDVHGLFYERYPEVSDVFATVIALIGIAGVFGYVYKRPLLDIRFWKLILYINLLTVFFTVYIIYVSYEGATEYKIEGTLLLTAMLIIMLPETIALYLYSFKSNHLWQ